MKIYNGVDHDINIVKGAYVHPENRKLIGGMIADTLYKQKALNAKIESVQTGEINGIPVFRKKITGRDPLPEGYDIYIVSLLYASAVMYEENMGEDADKIYTVADVVMCEDDISKRFGCLGITKYIQK